MDRTACRICGGWSRHFGPCTPRARLVERTERVGACLVWTGPVNGAGYGALWNGRFMDGAHRQMYEIEHGAIPGGMVVMHSCDNRRCVEPSHLRLGTQRDNLLDMIAKGRNGRGSGNRGKTHCKRGHPFTPENTLRERGGRRCRVCKNQQQNARSRAGRVRMQEVP